MLLIHCPVCGMDRPELEFRNGGQARIVRPADPAAASDAEWADFLYMRDNPKGEYFERWRHTNGCGRFFTVRRDTVTDRFLDAPEAPPETSA